VYASDAVFATSQARNSARQWFTTAGEVSGLAEAVLALARYYLLPSIGSSIMNTNIVVIISPSSLYSHMKPIQLIRLCYYWNIGYW